MLLIKTRNRRDDDPGQLEELTSNYPEVARFVDFVNNSSRGVVR